MYLLRLVLYIVLLQLQTLAFFLRTDFDRGRIELLSLSASTENPQEATRNLQAHRSIHRLYKTPKTDHQQPYRLQETLFQNALHSQEGVASGGTIKMLSSAGHIVPPGPSLSRSTCSLGSDALRLVDELAFRVLAVHSPFSISDHTAGSSNYTIEETVMLQRKETEYRATLNLKIDGNIDKGPFLGLMRLLVRTSEVLFVETGNGGFGTLVEKGEFFGVGFEASWTWYEFIDGTGRKCGS